MNYNSKRPNYNKLFIHSTKEDFLNYFFNTLDVANHLSTVWNKNLISTLKRLALIKDYYCDDDIYIYFKINHKLNKRLSRKDYTSNIFKLINFLYTNIEIFNVDSELSKVNSYVYYEKNTATDSFTRNLLVDFLVWDLDINTIKEKYNLQTDYLQKKLKKIHQLDLTPIDISLNTCVF